MLVFFRGNMAIIKLVDLKPGMIINRPLYHDGAVLMEKDTEIRENHIKQILSWGIETVEVLGQVKSINDLVYTQDKKDSDVRMPPGRQVQDEPPIYEVESFPSDIRQVQFDGKLVIRVDVPSGASISAKNGIEIYGNVGKGEFISPEGDIIFHGSVLGGGETYIEAKHFHSSRVVGCTIKTSGKVLAESIVASKIDAGEAVVCKTGEGSIVGGQIESGDRIQALNAGDDKTTLTELVVNNKMQKKIYETLRIHETQIQTEKDKLVKLEKIIQVIKTLGDKIRTLPPDKQRQLKEQTDLFIGTRDTLKRLSESHKKLSQFLEIRNIGKYLFITIENSVHPGVQICIGEQKLEVRSKGKGLGFSLVDNKIIVKDIA